MTNLVKNHIEWHPGKTVEQVQEELMLMSLGYFRSNKTLAAKALGISIRTIDNWLDRYNLKLKLKERQRKEVDQKRIDFLRRQRGNADQINQDANVQFGFPEKMLKNNRVMESSDDFEEGIENRKPNDRSDLIPEEEQENLQDNSVENNQDQSIQGEINANVCTTEQGDGLEPSIEDTKKPPVSVPVKKEVQKLLPGKPPKNRKKRRK